MFDQTSIKIISWCYVINLPVGYSLEKFYPAECDFHYYFISFPNFFDRNSTFRVSTILINCTQVLYVFNLKLKFL